jgi:two-component system, NtrC family, nitrogen regulation sensor histidine kinase GlnL
MYHLITYYRNYNMINNILNELRTPVFLINKYNKVVYLNAIGEEFFGHSANLIIGSSIYNLIPKDSPISNLLTRVRKFKNGLTEESLDFSNVHFPNRKVRAHIVPLSFDSSQIIIQFSELTVSEMFQSQRINTKISKSFSSMIDMLMHELKNPLAGIKGASQLIESDLNSDKNVKELTTLINVESDRIVSLLNRMEQINNNNVTLDYQFLNVHEVLNHCTRVSQNSFGSNIEFIDAFDPSLPDFFANKDLLIQILINLLKNSCEASTNNGKIKIKTSFNSDKKISFSYEEIPSSLPLQIEIIDYGIGIPKAMLPNIFDPFVSSKKKGKGLGLSIVASGLNDMGAVIEVSSSPGLTNFCMNFPLKKN